MRLHEVRSYSPLKHPFVLYGIAALTATLMRNDIEMTGEGDMKRLLQACIATLVLGGCAYVGPPSAMGVPCANRAQCDTYWQRAQAWVAMNSRYRIQIATDVVLQTYGSRDMELAYYITRVVNSDGSATIVVDATCGNMFGCATDPAAAKSDFRRFVVQSNIPASSQPLVTSPPAAPQPPGSSQMTPVRQPTVVAKPSPGPFSNMAEALALKDMCTPVGYALLIETGHDGDTYRVNCMGGMTKEYACAGQSCSPAR
ncbi:hypothetical protein [Cupriavidus numazuensis]|uniref:Lipoprotein n=1 Tax=Cupriavidus numazuensis TaxID=221992 RepID=A0ABN7QFA3_9BURK|nr:hypothetical protein [Cupriavidus numazuensis]CAG2161348.1 hypothetical protein LMG26411_08173 [Cupriavidus numazuensis]